MTLSDDEFQEKVNKRRRIRMEEIDRLAAPLRMLVHEYGWLVVKTCFDCGVTKPARIKHLVETVLNEFSPTRGTYSRQGIRTDVETHPAARALEE